MIIGYARVSTDGQTLDAQQSALTAAGAEKVFAEKISGAVTERKPGARQSRPWVRGRAACNAAG
jgi:DNA invertase Pin-like site-specific DNA recombinase